MQGVIGETEFEVVLKDGSRQRVRVQISMPSPKTEDGITQWECWLVVDPGMPNPRKPCRGFTSFDAILEAIAVCRLVITKELGAREVVAPYLIDVQSGDDGRLSIKEFFRMY